MKSIRQQLFIMETTNGLALASALLLSQSALTYKQWKGVYHCKKEKCNRSLESGLLNFSLVYEN